MGILSGFLALNVLFVGLVSAADEFNVIQSVVSMFESGGLLMWVMLITSVIGLTFVLERYFALRRNVHLPNELSAQVLWLIENETIEDALDYLKYSHSTLSRALRVVVSRVSCSREEIEKALDDELARALWDERKNIKTVGIVATIAPLMGLLGTVIGMIDAFKQAAESGMDNPAMFAGGIYQALYTTAFGLIISIPFVIVYHYLRSKVEHILRQVEDEALRFLDDVESMSELEEEISEAA